jgi:transposase-like protein
MNELTTEIIAALAQKQDLDEVFRHHLEIAINQLLQTELVEFLGYELNYLRTVYFNKYCNFKRI